ncbi:MAG TPA: hypothetical protein VNO84_16610 [Burkholderiaceae bacterium]|nr:hypothetical protein [Burkholderiaceae bacterium]
MQTPFDTGVGDEADALTEGESADAALEGEEMAAADLAGLAPDAQGLAFDDMDAATGEGFDTEVADDAALWNAFEEEIADGLDAWDEDEFFGRLLGGLGRAAGIVGRGMGAAARGAGRLQGAARQAGRVASQAGRVAQAASPAALAAARLARMLGAPGLAAGLGQAAQLARGSAGITRRAAGLAGAVGHAAGNAQGLFGQLSQLLSQSDSAEEAFDAVADLYENEGMDEALPALVGLAARTAARGLGLRNVAQLSQAARRDLVRGVAAAAREFARAGAAGPDVRVLPRLARSAARVAQARVPTPQQAVRTVRRGLPAAARRVARNPAIARRVTSPAPLTRPTDLGRGHPGQRPRAPRTYRFHGPVTLTITPQ